MPGDKSAAAIGRRITNLRKALGQTTAQLARNAGVPVAKLLNLEAGKITLLQRTADAISKALGVSAGYLYEGDAAGPLT